MSTCEWEVSSLYGVAIGRQTRYSLFISMKSFASITVRPMFIGTAALIVVTALSLRFAVPSAENNQEPTKSAAPISQSIPAFTSASFETGDALSSLGPEWTFVRQSETQGKTASTLSGMMPTRETLVHLSGKQTVMLITELKVTDATAMKKAVTTASIQPLTIVGRSGYLVPVPSLTGGSAFLLTGTSTALMLEYGEDRNGPLTQWPKDVPEAIQSYISVVKMY